MRHHLVLVVAAVEEVASGALSHSTRWRGDRVVAVVVVADGCRGLVQVVGVARVSATEVEARVLLAAAARVRSVARWRVAVLRARRLTQ